MAAVQAPTCPVTLVLLGEFGSGKSASGNTILGEDKFASRATADPLTTQCQKAERDVCGRWVTVIDTPDFFDQDLKQSERDRHIRECREMCKGQECLYLLVIQIGRFTAAERGILERLEKVLGRIRDRTIILFTYGDDLKFDQSIDDYVRNADKHLQTLIRECGDRYQVFKNKDKVKWKGQVERLMEQIYTVHVQENKKGEEGQVEGPMGQTLRVKVEETTEGKDGHKRMKRERSEAGHQDRPPRDTPLAQSSTCPITLVLLGKFGSGKSASGNTILGEDKFASRATAGPLTTQCQKEERDVWGTRVTVIDTPDFFDQDLEEPERDRHIRECREMCKGQECLYLLVIQIGRFTAGERGILKRLEKVLGRIRGRTIILFTYGGDLDQSIDDYVRNTDKHLQKLIEECGNRYNVFNNEIRDDQQLKELMTKISTVPQEQRHSRGLMSWLRFPFSRS